MLPTLCQCHQNEFCMTVSTVLCAFLCTQPKGHHACVAWNGIEVFQWQFNSVTKMNFTSNSWAETLSETFTHSVSSVSQIIYSLLCLLLEEISQCFTLLCTVKLSPSNRTTAPKLSMTSRKVDTLTLQWCTLQHKISQSVWKVDLALQGSNSEPDFCSSNKCEIPMSTRKTQFMSPKLQGPISWTICEWVCEHSQIWGGHFCVSSDEYANRIPNPKHTPKYTKT